MKKTLLLVLASALTAAPALAAVEMGAEAYITHKANLTEGAQNEGTDVDRFRIFVSNKFNDQWSFKGRFEFRADGFNKAYIPEAHFLGTGILMADDTLRFGIQDNPAFTIEASMGNRWITRPLVDAESFAISALQSGTSYAMKFAGATLTLFSLSGEAAENVDTTDNIKLNGAMIDYKFNDAVTAWVQHATQNEATANLTPVTAAKSTAVISAGVNYKSEMVDGSFNYHQATYTVETGTAPKSNTAMGLNGLFKNLAGSSTNLYAHYWAGFDKFEDTGEDTASKLMVGPAWKMADKKIDFGVFYEMETFQSAYKDANPAAKNPSAAYLKLAAKF